MEQYTGLYKLICFISIENRMVKDLHTIFYRGGIDGYIRGKGHIPLPVDSSEL